ncbi:MAG: hypothetical protein WAT12_16550 [Candidatus Nitrotoga sp.]
MPQIAPKEHAALRMWQSGCGATEDRKSNGAYCTKDSVVMGDVIDIGEMAWR